MLIAFVVEYKNIRGFFFIPRASARFAEGYITLAEGHGLWDQWGVIFCQVWKSTVGLVASGLWNESTNSVYQLKWVKIRRQWSTRISIYQNALFLFCRVVLYWTVRYVMKCVTTIWRLWLSDQPLIVIIVNYGPVWIYRSILLIFGSMHGDLTISSFRSGKWKC